MVLSRRLARLNRHGLNRLTRHVAPWAPGLGLVVHAGRRSGRTYQTPVELFPAPGGYVIALTYGPDTDWTKNVLAAGGCELRTGGKTIRVTEPRVYTDQTREHIRPFERAVLRLLGTTDFLFVRSAGPGGG